MGDIPAFLDFDLISTNNVSGFDPFGLSFTANTVDLSFGSGAVWASGAGANITARIVGSAAVPEPGSIALVGLAIAGLGMAKRRRKARARPRRGFVAIALRDVALGVLAALRRARRPDLG